MKMHFRLLVTALLIGFSQTAWSADSLLINGAGATFPFPIYTKWFSEYKKANPSVEINYASIGSGGGIRQLLDGTVDFGASDAPMTDEMMATSKKGPILHIPTVLGAVVLSYNLPGFTGDLRLSPEVIADIFMGKIKKWDDPKLVALNPKVTLPKDLNIIVATRSDGSGTTAVFTDYLSKVSPDWKSKVGAGTSVKWPAGLGGKGNEGVTGIIKQSKGALGYIELVYAESNKLPVAHVQNKAGDFVKPSPESVTAAADSLAKTMPEDYRVSITNAEGKKSYPISAYTFLLIYKEMPADKGPKIVDFLKWSASSGQKMAKTLSYASLPASVQKKVTETLKTITFKK